MKYEKPWMSESEIQTIVKYLKKDDVMLEWGSGGSTNYFPQFVKEYYSIEHDQNWFNEISQDLPSNVKYNFVGLDQPLTDPTQKQQIQTYDTKPAIKPTPILTHMADDTYTNKDKHITRNTTQ
jgi:hypothetical protein